MVQNYILNMVDSRILVIYEKYIHLNKSDITGWGGYPIKKANIIYPENVEQILVEVKKDFAFLLHIIFFEILFQFLCFFLFE